MEEKKKKQMIVGGSAAGAVAMGAGAAILMPGQEGEGQQEELLAQNITENSTEPVEVSVTPEEPNEPDSLSESANTPIEHDLAQKANTPNKPHVASKPSEPQEHYPCHHLPLALRKCQQKKILIMLQMTISFSLFLWHIVI